MFFLIITLFLLFFAILNLFVKNKLKRIIISVYLIIWLLVLLLSVQNSYGLYEVTSYTYGLVLASIFFFLLGSFFNNNFSSPSKNIQKTLNVNNIFYYINLLNSNKLVFFITILNVIIISRYYFLYQAAVNIVGAEKARYLRFFEGSLFQHTYEIYFYNYYFESLSTFYALFVVVCCGFQKFNKLFFLSVLFCFFFSGIGAGRFFLIELSYYFFIILIIRSVLFNMAITKKLKLFFTLSISLMYFVSVYFVNFRRGINDMNIAIFLDGNKVLFEQGIIYNIGALRALDFGITNYPSKIQSDIIRLYIGGVDELLCVFVNFFGANIDYANAKLGKITFEEINIGNGYTFNALYTNVLPMYLDFNVFGVIIFSFINGLVFSFFFKKMFNNPNIINIIVFTNITVIFYLTTMVWKFSAPSTWIFLLLCLVLSKKVVK